VLLQGAKGGFNNNPVATTKGKRNQKKKMKVRQIRTKKKQKQQK